MIPMSFNKIKESIHQKYPGKYTDTDIENMPIILINEYDSQSSVINSEYITIKDINHQYPYNIDEYNLDQYNINELSQQKVIFVSAF